MKNCDTCENSTYEPSDTLDLQEVHDIDQCEKCARKTRRVDFRMKYIGWNLGSVRIERETHKGDIEILEMSIDGVDILKLIPDSLFKEKNIK